MADFLEMPAEPGTGRGWRAATASMRHPQFRWIYVSNLAFFFAMNGQFVVRSYLAFKLTNSAFALGLVNLAVAIPMLLFSPFGGVIADRMDKRTLIMAGQAVLLANEAVVMTLLIGGWLEFWHLFVAVFVMGCMFPVIMPARQAIVVDIVGRRGLANAMALQQGAMNAARVVGPALAGFLIYFISVRGAYIVAITLYGLALLAVTRLGPAPPVPRSGRQSVFGDMAEGFRYVWRDRPVRALMLLGIIPPLLSMPFQALLVVFAEDVWDVGSRGLGILQAAAGIGGVLGSVVVAYHGEARRKLRTMMASLLGFAGSLFLFALSPWFIVALPLVLIADVFANVFQTVNGTTMQTMIPDAVRGRVMSLMMMTFGLTPLGTVPIAAAAQAWGAPVAVAGAAVVSACLSTAFFFLSGSLRGIDASSRRPFADEPAAADLRREPALAESAG
jgi:MFS family permease